MSEYRAMPSLARPGGLRNALKLKRRRVPTLILPVDQPEESENALITLPAPKECDIRVDDNEVLGSSDDEIPVLGPFDNPASEQTTSQVSTIDLNVLALNLTPCKCQNGCLGHLTEQDNSNLKELREKLRKQTKKEQDWMLFHLVKAAKIINPRKNGEKVGNALAYTMLGKPVCVTALLSMLGIGNGRFQRINTALALGRLQPWDDLREYNGGNTAGVNAYLDADAFFCFAYQFLAEPLGDGEDYPAEICMKTMGNYLYSIAQVRDGDPVAHATVGLQVANDMLYMATMSWPELYEYYLAWNIDGINTAYRKASKSCFDKCYNERWSNMLRIRGEGQHGRCKTCAENSKAIRDAETNEEKNVARQKQKKHLNRMFDDRTVDMRLTRMSEISTSANSSFRGVLHMRIDAVNQVQLRYPRNLEDNKQWSTVWRPNLHLTGVIVEGVLELYVVSDQDMMKGSNHEIEVLCRAFDLSKEVLEERGVPMPEHASVKYDNTGREGKNQIVAKMMSTLVGRNKFRSIQDGAPEPGHTHDGLDQRFMVIISCWMREPLIQCPDDFVNSVTARYTPARNRQLSTFYAYTSVNPCITCMKLSQRTGGFIRKLKLKLLICAVHVVFFST